MTIDALIKDCVQAALGLPRDPIQTDVYEQALAVVNSEGQKIWDSWPWDNTKLDEFDAPTPDSDGIITFASNVDVVRALRTTTDDGTGVRVYSQDEVQAVGLGQTVSSERFIPLKDDASGNRRIQVYDEDADYRVLATYRFTPYTTVTALTESYPIDRAEQALKAFTCDMLRIWAGEQPVGDGPSALATAFDKENNTQDRDRQVVPRHPMFEESGDWY